MAKPTGFMDYHREEPSKRKKAERILDYREFEFPLTAEKLHQQAARCMDCGVPHCHAYGCPVQNRIPDWNDMVYRDQWRRALDLLQSTDNFPEFTGRICPAPCEAACTLSIHQEPVTIRHIELQIVERGWREGWIKPQRPAVKSGKRVAVVGSGPSGLAAAQQLARKGHEVILFERADRIGGLLRYGIPDFKLEKWIIDRRLEQMQAEGVIFETNVNAGVDLSVKYMQRSFDAILMTTGATRPRDLTVPGRDLAGIHFAMDFLSRQNKIVAGDALEGSPDLSATGKKVVVIGGGDTGSDCVGTSIRQGASQVTQIELLPKPPEERTPSNPWPEWPATLRTTSSHEEGCERMWSMTTKGFNGHEGNVTELEVMDLQWSGRQFKEIEGSTRSVQADMVLLAMGFVHVEHGPLVTEAALCLDNRGNIAVDDNHMTCVPGIFAAGDAVQGASLVVRAIYQGRQAAASVHRYLAGI
jgi:NAD(P)H-dependent glutamate synthase small subunit